MRALEERIEMDEEEEFERALESAIEEDIV